MSSAILNFRLAGAPYDALERVTEDELCDALGPTDGDLARRAIERHEPRGILRHGGHVWLTRFHCRWACSWIAGITRVEPRVLLERIGLAVAR